MPVRFRFCGDDEVPDWVLAGVHDIHSIDTEKLKILVQTVIDAILHPDFTIENDHKATVPVELVEYKTLLAALVFIIQNAVASDVAELTLSNELQQIGFPLEHTTVLCKIYTEYLLKLKLKAKQLSLRCSVPKSVKVVKDDSNIMLKLEAWQASSNSKEEYSISVTKEQLDLLVEELSTVYEKIDSLV